MMAMAVMLVGLAAPASAVQPETAGGFEVEVPFGAPDNYWDADGTSSTLRNADGMSLSWDVEGLVPGNVYSVWWGVANVTSECAPSGDIYVFNATGGIANSMGEAHFRSHINTTPPRGQFPDVLRFEGGGDITPLMSHVFNVVVNHGPLGSNEFTTAQNMHSILGATATDEFPDEPTADVLIHDNPSQWIRDNCPT
jgi:hypothetical protein